MSEPKPVRALHPSDDFLMKTADILGASSAASRALAERDRRRKAGEDVIVLWDRDRGILFVGPRPLSENGHD